MNRAIPPIPSTKRSLSHLGKRDAFPRWKRLNKPEHADNIQHQPCPEALSRPIY